jgi:hypothetical protein
LLVGQSLKTLGPIMSFTKSLVQDKVACFDDYSHDRHPI